MTEKSQWTDFIDMHIGPVVTQPFSLPDDEGKAWAEDWQREKEPHAGESWDWDGWAQHSLHGLQCAWVGIHYGKYGMLWAVSQRTDTSKDTKGWAVSQHIDTSKNTKAWAASQCTDTSNTKAWAVSQHIDTSKDTKA